MKTETLRTRLGNPEPPDRVPYSQVHKNHGTVYSRPYARLCDSDHCVPTRANIHRGFGEALIERKMTCGMK